MQAVALVTGGSRGIGKAAARALARADFTLALTGRSERELERAAAAIRADGGRAEARPAEVTDPNEVTRLAEWAETLGSVDVLVNSAGIFGPVEPFAESDPAEWWRAIEVNLRGPMLCARAVLPGMLARRRGRVVNVTSRQGNRPEPMKNGYTTSKAALTRWTEALAVDHPKSGVTFFALAPGPTPTDMTRELEGRRAARTGDRVPAPAGPAPDVPLDHGAIRILVAIATGKLDAFNGRYLSVDDDVDALLAQAEVVGRDDTRVLRLRG